MQLVRALKNRKLVNTRIAVVLSISLGKVKYVYTYIMVTPIVMGNIQEAFLAVSLALCPLIKIAFY